MAKVFVPVKNLVVEWRYKANLAIYSKMDEVGLHFQDEYPDWQRSALTLEIRNKKARRRFFISHSRCFYDVVGPMDNDIAREMEEANELFVRLAEAAQITKVTRVGIRQWAAFGKDQPFKDLAKRVKAKFHPAKGEIEAVLQGTVEDLGYIVDVAVEAGWKYRLWIGPMEKKQWFEIVVNDEGLFPTPLDFATYKETFPSQFLYADIDSYKEDVTLCDLTAWMSESRRITHQIFNDIDEFFEKV